MLEEKPEGAGSDEDEDMTDDDDDAPPRDVMQKLMGEEPSKQRSVQIQEVGEG